ncbi:hypothetical protein RUM44_008013 [Polyplax serrata]|uniref:Uncharacterized protein n=1 Tax=Polyplax serrata TaxID=468196 RepID=A0ABR1B7K0_POLSC
MTDTVSQSNRRWDEPTAIQSNDICRICLSASVLLIPIFSGEGLEQGLQEKVDKHLPVTITETDTLSRQICCNCVGTLLAWDTLYTCCLKTDKKLQSLLSNKQSSWTDQTNENNFVPDEETSVSSKKIKLNNICKTVLENGICKSEVYSAPLKEENSEANVKSDSVKEGLGAVEEVAKSGKFQLDTTQTVDSTENELNAVTVKSTVSDGTKCENCDKNFRDKNQLKRHMKRAHGDVKNEEPLRCEMCKNVYKTRGNLERHQVKEHLTDQVTCPVCNGSFNSKKLESHLKSAHGVKTEPETEAKFKCKLCDKWFKNKYVRNSHVKEVHLSEPVKCKLCDFEGARTVVRRHKRDVHVEKRFFCSLCPGAFKTLHTLKMHMTSHSDVRCYTCDICGMGFKRLNNVRDHMKCHQQKSNQCQICGNFFARKRYLAIHEKTIHNFYADGIVPEEKGFECEICGAKLKWKKNLLAHMRIHTGEKPYVCKICNKDFICHGTLRTHMAKHNVCTPTENDSQQVQ